MSSPDTMASESPDTGNVTRRKDASQVECYKKLSRSISEVLHDVGVCVIDEYIPNTHIADFVVNEVKSLYAIPELFSNPNGSYRSDYVYWLNGNEPTQTSCCNKLEKSFEILMAASVKQKLIPKLSHKSRFQVSCFPKGSFGYKRHCDNLTDNGRLLTIVYYCRDRGADGGVHRFHVVDKDKNHKALDIEAKFNRAVIYWSDNRVFHETLPCEDDLFSLTSWYFSSLNENTFA